MPDTDFHSLETSHDITYFFLERLIESTSVMLRFDSKQYFCSSFLFQYIIKSGHSALIQLKLYLKKIHKQVNGTNRLNSGIHSNSVYYFSFSLYRIM